MGLEQRGTSCSIWRTAFLVSAFFIRTRSMNPQHISCTLQPSMNPASPPTSAKLPELLIAPGT
jgi:hypothetical protein